MRDSAHEKLYKLLSDPVPEVIPVLFCFKIIYAYISTVNLKFPQSLLLNILNSKVHYNCSDLVGGMCFILSFIMLVRYYQMVK